MRQRLHAERVALHDARDERGEPIVVVRRGAHDSAHLRHVVVLELAPDRIHHELLRDRLHELIGAIEQRLA